MLYLRLTGVEEEVCFFTGSHRKEFVELFFPTVSSHTYFFHLQCICRTWGEFLVPRSWYNAFTFHSLWTCDFHCLEVGRGFCPDTRSKVQVGFSSASLRTHLTFRSTQITVQEQPVMVEVCSALQNTRSWQILLIQQAATLKLAESDHLSQSK